MYACLSLGALALSLRWYQLFTPPMMLVGWGVYWHSVLQKGGWGVGWYNRNAWWGANGQMRIGEKFLSSVANQTGAVPLWDVPLHIVASTRTVCSEGGRLQEIKHLANCWGGSFGFSLSLSCQKWERRKITWERPLDLRSAAASSQQIWNTHITSYLQLFELTHRNLSSRCDLCLLLQTLCWTLWGNSLWERHIMICLCMNHHFWVIKLFGNFDKKFPLYLQIIWSGSQNIIRPNPKFITCLNFELADFRLV